MLNYLQTNNIPFGVTTRKALLEIGFGDSSFTIEKSKGIGAIALTSIVLKKSKRQNITVTFENGTRNVRPARAAS